jgi:hypothetical protein
LWRTPEATALSATSPPKLRRGIERFPRRQHDSLLDDRHAIRARSVSTPTGAGAATRNPSASTLSAESVAFCRSVG